MSVFLLMILFPDCQNITVTLKNDALVKHNDIQGVYHYFGLINGKTSWVLPSANKAIWYLPQLPTSDWVPFKYYIGNQLGRVA